MKYVKTDEENSRIYYRNQQKIHCFQELEPHKFVLLDCFTNGYPAGEIQLSRFNFLAMSLPKPSSLLEKRFALQIQLVREHIKNNPLNMTVHPKSAFHRRKVS